MNIQEPARWTYSLDQQGNSVASYPGAVITDLGSAGLNVKEYGAKGDAVGVSGGATITAGSTQLIAPNGKFAPGDVGKTIVVSEIASATMPPLITTIAGVTGPTLITLATPATASFPASARYVYGSDDTAAVTAAVAAGQAMGQPVVFPAGIYMLATQTVSINVTNVKLVGEGTPANYYPFSGGTLIAVFCQTVPAFTGLAGTVLQNMAFWYPGIDNTQATPVAYPPTFEATFAASNGEVNNWIDKCRVLNAYRFIHATADGGSIARTWMTDCFVYAVDAVFYLQSGFADSVFLNNCYFGMGAYAAEATWGPAYLQKYTLAHGAVFRIDVGAGHYTACDGLLWNGGLVQQYHYAVQMFSGMLDVSCLTGINFDGVQQILDVEGTGFVTSTSICGGEAYCGNPVDATVNQSLILFNTSTATNDLTVSGVYFTFCMGNLVEDKQGTLQTLTLVGNHFANWGRSSTAGQYYVYGCDIGAPGEYVISGNLFDGARGTTSNTTMGLFASCNGQMTVTGNVFHNCTYPMFVQGSSGVILAVGNVATGSGAAVTDSSSGTLRFVQLNNSWDVQPSTRLPTASGGATVASGSTNMAGTVTMAAAQTSVTLTFTSALPYAPRSVQATSQAAGGVAQVSAISATGFTLTGATAAALNWAVIV